MFKLTLDHYLKGNMKAYKVCGVKLDTDSKYGLTYEKPISPELKDMSSSGKTGWAHYELKQGFYFVSPAYKKNYYLVINVDGSHKEMNCYEIKKRMEAIEDAKLELAKRGEI